MAPLPLTPAPFADLVFHGLRYLPIDPADHSALYAPEYVARYEAARAAVAPTGGPRTLPADAARLAAAYDAAPEGSALGLLALCHDEPGAFAATAAQPFAELPLPRVLDPIRAELLAGTGEGLVDLFRIALWGELRGGAFLAVRTADDVDGDTRGVEEMVRLVARWSRGLPRPREFSAIASLGREGRALPLPEGWWVLVGRPDRRADVPAWASAVQAVHEQCVIWAGDLAGVDRPTSPRPGRPGYAAFWEEELLALSLQADFAQDDTDHRRAFAAWIDRLFPGGVPDVVERLALVGREVASPSLSLGAWLASGAAVAPSVRAAFDRERVRIRAAR